MRHYGDAREEFKMVKDYLGDERADEIEGKMRDAARRFSRDFDARRLGEIVETHRNVLEELTAVVGRTLGELRRQAEAAVAEAEDAEAEAAEAEDAEAEGHSED